METTDKMHEKTPKFVVGNVVWVYDIYHRHYPEYVKILAVLDDGEYQVQVERGPIITIKEDQLSDEPGCF